MRQAGVIAAPCIVALDNMIDRLADDHRRTRKIAQGILQHMRPNHPIFIYNSYNHFILAIHDLEVDFIRVDLEGLHTNILMLYFNTPAMTATEFCGRLVTVSALLSCNTANSNKLLSYDR